MRTSVRRRALVGLMAVAASLVLALSVRNTETPHTRASPGTLPDGSPIRLMATPAAVLHACESSRLLRPACPRRLPYVNHLPSESPYDVFLCRIGRKGCAGLTWDDLELEHAGPGDRPPAWAHMSVEAGRIASSPASLFPWPIKGNPVQPRNGLFSHRRSQFLFLGQIRVGARGGMLILAPSYPLGGMVGDHLIFYWRANSIDYVISLHGWEPFLQVVATLRAIVASTDAATGH